MTKRLLAALLAVAALFALVGCGKSDKADAAPKDYTKILHDARPDEDNEYYMIFSPGEDGKFTADDYKALVAAMFDGSLTVSNDISKTASDFATVITLDDQGSIK